MDLDRYAYYFLFRIMSSLGIPLPPCRVKSLHQGGVGKLFGEVPHISMKDLSRNLKEARKINGIY